MPRYKLRTLLLLLTILPPLLWIGWTKYEAWRAEQAASEYRAAVERAEREQRLGLERWMRFQEMRQVQDTLEKPGE